MFEYNTPTHTSSYRGALEIEAQARKQEKIIAIMVAEYEAEAANGFKRAENPFKNLFANLFGGMKAADSAVTPNRDLASATNK